MLELVLDPAEPATAGRITLTADGKRLDPDDEQYITENTPGPLQYTLGLPVPKDLSGAILHWDFKRSAAAAYNSR